MSFKIDAKEKVELLEAVDKLRSFIEFLEVNKSCHNCAYFETLTRGCEKFMQSPPEHVIKVGCASWELFSSLPF